MAERISRRVKEYLQVPAGPAERHKKDCIQEAGFPIIRPAGHLRKPPKAPARRIAWIGLAVGALASLAMSPPLPAANLNRLVRIDGVLYAVDTEQKIVDQSEDGGRTWKEIYRESGYPHDKVPADVPLDNLLEVAVTLPLVTCHPREPQRCYRITGEERIDTSTDGGQSWEIAWTTPPGRRAFMERYRYWRPLDLVPRDLLLFDWQGQTYLLAAAGTEGVLRHRIPDGEWERRGVPSAQPTPYAVEEFAAAADIVYNEISLGVAAALFTLLGTCALSWRTLRRHMEQPDPPYATWQPLRPLLIVVATGSILIPVSVVLRFPVMGCIPLIGPACCLPLWLGLGMVVLALVLTWWRFTREMPHLTGPGWLAAWWGLVFAAVLLQATIPWFLWARGIIAFYGTALLLALLTLPLIAGGLYGAWWMSRRVATSRADSRPE